MTANRLLHPVGRLGWIGIGCAAVLMTLSVAVEATECKDLTHRGLSYSVCSVDLTTEEIEVFHRDEARRLIGTFSALERRLDAVGRRLEFAMNGGMFDEHYAPIGLLVVNRAVVRRVRMNGWPGEDAVPPGSDGNFFRMPNGVMAVTGQTAAILSSKAYKEASPRPDSAVQSGPLLIQGAQIPSSLDGYNAPTHRRNGVCTASPQRLIFAISNEKVGIRTFAAFMKDGLHCNDALYLDGCRSALFSRALNRRDESCPNSGRQGSGLPMAVMVGVSTASSGAK